MIDWNDTRLFLSGRIEDDDAGLVCDWLQLAGVRDRLVCADFNSSGSSVWAALKIHDAFLEHGKVYGCVTGECSSGAVVAYAACKNRIAKPEARFMMHRCYSMADGTRNEETRDNDNVMVLKMSRSLGLDFSEVHSWIQSDSDHEFDADKAMRMGLVDLIIGRESKPSARRRNRTAQRPSGTKRDRIMAALQSVKGLPPLWNIDANMRTPAMARALSSFTRNGTQTVQGKV